MPPLVKKTRSSKYSDINNSLYEWYSLACSKNIYPDGPQLIEKAREIAKCLGKHNFVGTNGWLDKWKQRYHIRKVTICGESGDVSGATVASWKERLPEILQGYEKRNVYNLDETGCFWRALPNRGFIEKGKRCSGGKKSKLRFTIGLLVNACGEKEPPIVIWSSANPRCFRGFDKNALPVKYYSQPRAWMTGEILDSVLTSFNLKMKSQERSILLLLDNAGCHPVSLQGKYSNIKIVFLPPNTTSKLQPLDLGIICNFKTHFRRLFLKYVVSKIDAANNASEVISSVNVLMAIRWVALAWREVKEITITKSFKNAGILNDNSDVVEVTSEDPFQDIDERMSLGSLISTAMGSLDSCSVEEYVQGDNLEVCADFDSEHWENNFMDSLTGQEESNATTEEISDSEEVDIPPPSPKLKNFRDALTSLEDVQIFLESRGCSHSAHANSMLMNQVASDYISTLKQSTLDQYIIP